jgi:DNA-binding MarR family transcriptional regulator
MVEIPVEEYLCTRIRRAEQALMARHETVLRRYGLTQAQYTVMLSLHREGGLSGAQLARASGVTQQTMATVLGGLQSKGLVQREASPVHAKVQIASLTDEGVKLLEQAYDDVVVLDRALTDAFTPAEHAALCDLLDRATDFLHDQARSAIA